MAKKKVTFFWVFLGSLGFIPVIRGTKQANKHPHKMNTKPLTAPATKRNDWNTKMFNAKTDTLHALVQDLVISNPEGTRTLTVLFRHTQDGTQPYGSAQLSKIGEPDYYGYQEWKDTKWYGDLTWEAAQALIDRKVKEWKIQPAVIATIAAGTQISLF